ncbi:MAG: flavodoxin family protein [Sedimentisphaerales bacterium]|nr:flavodoxin family protein [Sedimentisphaerales bacterium]
MKKNVLGISTSPRRNGNSDLLIKKALSGAESVGANVEYLSLNDYKIGPCIECNSCYKTGRCVIKDDYEQVLEKILNADRLIFATPVFFMSVCAQAKLLIDRGQCLWAEKYILKRENTNSSRDYRAMVIATGGSKSKKQYECAKFVFKTYFDCLNIKYKYGLFVGKVDELGAIEKHSEALEEAYRLGSMIASPDSPLPENPIEVELIYV